MDDLAGLTPEQAATVAKARERMARRKREDAVTADTLKAMENSWRQGRRATIAAAAEYLDAKILSLDDVTAALNISKPTWWRWRRELTGRGEAEATR